MENGGKLIGLLISHANFTLAHNMTRARGEKLDSLLSHIILPDLSYYTAL
jgi:hypothetical protein